MHARRTNEIEWERFIPTKRIEDSLRHPYSGRTNAPCLLRRICVLCAALAFSALALSGCIAPSSGPVTVDLKQGRSAAEYNTLALQHAINNASYQGGGELRLPAGTFYFSWNHEDEWSSYAIIMRDNVSIVGAGMSETFLMPLGTYSETGEAEHGVDMFSYDGTETNKYLVNADFSDFTIDGSATQGKPEGYNASGKGFFFTLFKDCDWKRVKVMNTDGTGFGADYPVNCTMVDCIATQCGKNATAESVGASGFGVGIGYSEEESMLIENCASYDNTKYGFFFEHQTIFDNPATKASRAEGYVVRDCSASGNLYNFGGNRANDVRFVACTSNTSPSSEREGYTRSAFQFHNYSTRISVEGGAISQHYEDVSEQDECYEAISWALACNVAEVGSRGYNDFRPGDGATRGEVAVFLWRYAGRPGEVFFGPRVVFDDPAQDVSFKSYCAEAVRWLKSDGLSVSDPFRPQDPITYREFATLLWRYSRLLDSPESMASDAAQSADGEHSTRSEAKETSEHTAAGDVADAVAWAHRHDILPFDESSDKLDDACTREGVIEMLYAFDRIEA